MPRRLELVSRDPRHLVLGARNIEYVLVRRRGRRGVGLKVDEAGLTVSSPATMPLARIEALVRESEAWILRKLSEWGGRRTPAAEWHDGARLPYLGGGLALRLATGTRARAERVGDELHVATRGAGAEEIRRTVVAWYKRMARDYLQEQVAALTAAAGISPPRVFISSALARWGSCNARREVVKAPRELIDYVICHELAHLRHMDHSSAFWAEVERQCPDYRSRRARLHATDHFYRSF
jgi:predicted metal-dependent hydrolase